MKKENKVYLVKSSECGNLGVYSSLKKVTQYLSIERGFKNLKISPSNDYKTLIGFTYKNLLKEFKTGFIAFLEVENSTENEEIEITCFALNEYL